MLRLLCLIAVLIGCKAGNSPDTSPKAPAEAKAAPAQQKSKYDAFSDEACRCKDEACAKKAVDQQGQLRKAAFAELERNLGLMNRGKACLREILPGAEQSFEQWATEACQCKDLACGKKQEKELEALIARVEGQRGDNEAAQKSVMEGMQCLMKLHRLSHEKPSAPNKP